jgi:hypothetical protein
MQRRLLVTDVSGQPIGLIFRDEAVQDDFRKHVRSYMGNDVDVDGVSEEMIAADRVNERWKTLASNS